MPCANLNKRMLLIDIWYGPFHRNSIHLIYTSACMVVVVVVTVLPCCCAAVLLCCCAAIIVQKLNRSMCIYCSTTWGSSRMMSFSLQHRRVDSNFIEIDWQCYSPCDWARGSCCRRRICNKHTKHTSNTWNMCVCEADEPNLPSSARALIHV